MISTRRAMGLVGALAIALAALTMPGAALAGASEDCEKLRGDAAIAACDQAIKANPRDVISLRNRGLEHQNKGQFDRALADLNRALEIKPDHAHNHAVRGNIHLDMGNADRAIADLSEAIRLDPKGAPYYSDRGVAYDSKRDYDRAIADYNQAIQLDPKLAQAYDNRANAYRAKGDRVRAAADYAQAIRLDPRRARVFIFFDYESASVGQSAQPLIDRIAELTRNVGAKEVRVVAHTDSAEPNSKALSMARATAIRTALVAKGVPANVIVVEGAGSTSPLVPTAKGAKEPQNRRAQVLVVP